MNEYTDYLIQWLIHGNGNFVTAEYLADLAGRDLQKDLQEIYGLYNVNIRRLATSNLGSGSGMQGIVGKITRAWLAGVVLLPNFMGATWHS